MSIEFNFERSLIMKIIVALCCFISVQFTSAQSTPKEYDELIKQADTLYHSKNYKASALAYSSAFKILGWKGYLEDRYNAARAWAMAGDADSAFFNLERIVTKLIYA